ncbi:MAG TPA: indolepyruvate ferredoxin oxidoreductase subunit alpha [bacterium]|nr:indolepyruvate ferredoxin oxidoreductase subunit alpha [bacterium]HPJ71535.1 indolepyruvate ferredoxin oxidoreductase subunit alpha [bacterium]HPQ65783.1 indolepyruvate ferredoxin oxidoreductase subunit alpha [bacterium]
MDVELLSGNAAFARGAWEAGVTVATAYPGTPSTEILEHAAEYKRDIYCEWSPNEKVAFEVAAAASLAGARALTAMKHVGLNVAADPLMTMSYVGAVGGFVVCVADDPGMYSSQNGQDTRHYARFAKIPMLEPSDSAEARDYVATALDLSEEFSTPVLLRSTTCLSHSRTPVEPGPRREPSRRIGFVKDPPRFVPVPAWARNMRVEVEARFEELARAAQASPLNRIETRDTSLGIITGSVPYQFVREVWPEASVLKLGFPYPFPDELIRGFASRVDRILVVEELDPFLEEHVRSLGIPCRGKDVVPVFGELNPTVLRESRRRLEKRPVPPSAPRNPQFELPGRPPVLCAGCSHRGIFAALGKLDVVVTGDIGCYALGALPPLDRMDTILCMGAGVSMAHGLDKAGEPRKVVGIVGDSTFFHSGITGLLDIAYNRGAATIIVLDNRTTAMTGHQENPGTGRTLMGEETPPASIAGIGKACGIERVFEVDPYRLEETVRVLEREIASPEPSLIVSRGPCVLRERVPLGPVLKISEHLCRECKRCLKLGCPAIEYTGGPPEINRHLCNGCGLCPQVCPFGAIGPEENPA